MESAELLKLLRDAARGVPDNVPPGWRTTRQWVAEWKISETAALRLIQRGLESGLMERRDFRVRTKTATLCLPHYRTTK